MKTWKRVSEGYSLTHKFTHSNDTILHTALAFHDNVRELKLNWCWIEEEAEIYRIFQFDYIMNNPHIQHIGMAIESCCAMPGCLNMNTTIEICISFVISYDFLFNVWEFVMYVRHIMYYDECKCNQNATSLCKWAHTIAVCALARLNTYGAYNVPYCWGIIFISLALSWRKPRKA